MSHATPDYFQATPAESVTRSELVVPIKLHGEVIGALDLQSEQVDAFDEQDLQMAQAVADQVAHALEAIQHFNRVRILQELNEQIVENLPYAVALLDDKGSVVIANEQFCREICRRPREEVIGRQLERRSFPSELQKSLLANRFPSLDEAICCCNSSPPRFLLPRSPLWRCLA
jgi:GAF domain-containing protein